MCFIVSAVAAAVLRPLLWTLKYMNKAGACTMIWILGGSGVGVIAAMLSLNQTPLTHKCINQFVSLCIYRVN